MLGGNQIEHAMAKQNVPSTYSYLQCQPQTIGNISTQTILGQAEPPPHWSWLIPFHSAQMGYGAPTAACECGAEKQTADHIIIPCPIFHHPNRGIGLESVNEKTVAWLDNILPNI